MELGEIQAGLRRCQALPDGRDKAQQLEDLAAAAKVGPDRVVEASVLLALTRCYTFGGEGDLAPAAYARLLRIYDEFPAELGHLEHTVHWQLKWMTQGLVYNPSGSVVDNVSVAGRGGTALSATRLQHSAGAGVSFGAGAGARRHHRRGDGDGGGDRGTARLDGGLPRL